MNGILETIDGRPALRFERHLAHPIERVWRAVTVPAELGRWFPAAADWTPEAGETFEVAGETGQVTKLEPPQVIEWVFGSQLFRFELCTQDKGCSLTFIHVFDDRSIAAQTAAGWECYFDRLDVQLAGGFLSEERAHAPAGERHERYARQFEVDPAPGRAFIATALDFRGLTLDVENGPVLRLERRYDQSVERVWQALIDPVQRQQWFAGELDVTESEPPHRLVGRWQSDGIVTFELSPDGESCVLVFTHSFTDRDQAGLAAAGWDRCFARLDALFAGNTMSEADSLTL